MIVVTGATGRLGRLVVDGLLARGTADRITVAVRDPAKAAGLSARGVRVRRADYDDPDSLEAAFTGADRLLLISTNDYAASVRHHTAAVEAAKRAGVGRLAYTSLGHADTTSLRTAIPHRLTEPIIRDSGLPFTILRNSLYTDVFAPQIRQAAASGTLLNSAGTARLATGTRGDFAAAAVAVLTGEGHDGKVYELSGEETWSFPELAARLSTASEREVTARPVSPDEHVAILVAAGVPAQVAELLVDVFRAAAAGELAATSGDLRRLIGRPATPLADVVSAALAA